MLDMILGILCTSWCSFMDDLSCGRPQVNNVSDHEVQILKLISFNTLNLTDDKRRQRAYQ